MFAAPNIPAEIRPYAPDSAAALRAIDPAEFAEGKTVSELAHTAFLLRQIRNEGYARADDYEESCRLQQLANHLDECAFAVTQREVRFLILSVRNRFKAMPKSDAASVYLGTRTIRRMLDGRRFEIRDMSSPNAYGYAYSIFIADTEYDYIGGSLLRSQTHNFPTERRPYGFAEVFEEADIERLIVAYDAAIEAMPVFTYSAGLGAHL